MKKTNKINIFARLDVNAIRDGIITKVGGTQHFGVLVAIASFADEKGVAFPSQDTIADLIGYGRQTVSRYINHLKKVSIDGNPVLIITQEVSPKGRRNKYQLTKYSGFIYDKGEVTAEATGVVDEEARGIVTVGRHEVYTVQVNTEEVNKDKDIVFSSPKGVLEYFRKQYFKRYETNYQPNWGRDITLLKNNLMNNYTDQQIKSIVDVVIREYDDRWANGKYPRPTIGQICTWLGNEAINIVASEEKESKRIEEDSKKYELDEDQFERMLEELN